MGNNVFVDAKFEVLGTPNSLLSVTLSASQNLYTRRGTLVGMSGKADNVRRSSRGRFKTNTHVYQAISTLSLLSPLKRAALRIPFFYQKVCHSIPVCITSADFCGDYFYQSSDIVIIDQGLQWLLYRV